MELDILMGSLMSPLDSGIGSMGSVSGSSPTPVQVCPLCNTELQSYRLSFSSRFRMCGSAACDFPFNLSRAELEALGCPDAPGDGDGGGGEGGSLSTAKSNLCVMDSGDRAQDLDAYLDADADDSDGGDADHADREANINRLLQHSSKLVAMLNLRKKSNEQTAFRHARRPPRPAGASPRARRRPRQLDVLENIQVSIQLPATRHDLVTIDVMTV